MAQYATPAVRFEMAVLEYQGAQYLCFQVEEFENTPVVCRHNGENGTNIKVGAIFVRPFSGRPRSTIPTTAEQLSDLLDRAAEKRARKILTQAHGIGLSVPPSQDLYDEEIKDL